MTAWPGKIWLTIGVLLAVGASVLLFRRWSVAPLIVGCTALATIFLWPAIRYGSDAAGLRIAGLPFPSATAALLVIGIGIVAFQLWRLASSPRLPRWARFVPVVIAAYAIALIVFAVVRAPAQAGALSGNGPVPWWMSGAYIGGAILLPLGVVLSLVMLGIAIAKRRTAILSAAAVLLLMVSAFTLSGLALTRSGRPNLAQFIVPASMNVSSPIGTEIADQSATISSGLGAGDETLAPYEGKDLDDIFNRVATGVRYEPYAGILRGASGTAVARSGNAADQSMLLAELLRRAGYRVRYARGPMPDQNVDAVIRGMYPPTLNVEKLADEYLPYDPASDEPLRSLVRDHIWVEVFQGESWLPLDPAFPRARAGESYAESSEQFDTPPDNLFHSIDATLKEESANGQSRDLGTFSVRVADLAMKPISLVVRAIPQSTGGDVPAATGGPAAAIGGMGGALGGATEAPPPEPPKKTEKQIVGVAYVRDMTIGGAPQTLKRTTVKTGDAGAAIRREWIELDLSGPSVPSRRVERVLYENEDGKAQPSIERRYTISILSGRIPRSFVDDQTRLARSLVNVREFENKAEDLADISADDPRARDAAVQLGQMGDALGTVAGHLLALRFASESDSLSRRIADGTGLALAWATPRILIVGMEMAGGKKGQIDAKVSLDLRLDELKAYPYPSAPAGIVPVFQVARGIQESVIEGRLVALATGKDPTANTAELVSAAQKQNVPLVVINASTRSRLGEIAPGIPATCVQMMDAALAKGREIIVPSRAVALAGGPQWGWWEVDPASGNVIGVMQDGQHQGMAEYSVNSEAIGLNDESGQVLGMMMGSITTVGTLSALILEYGTVTPELIKRLEAYVGDLLCNSCMESAGVKISAGGGMSTEAGNECYKASGKLGGKVEVGGEVKVGFCEAYAEGFKCAAGMILRALKNDALVSAKTEIAFGAESDAKIGCKDVGGD